MLPTSSSAGNAAWAACGLEAFAAACAKAALDAAHTAPLQYFARPHQMLLCTNQQREKAEGESGMDSCLRLLGWRRKGAQDPLE